MTKNGKKAPKQDRFTHTCTYTHLQSARTISKTIFIFRRKYESEKDRMKGEEGKRKKEGYENGLIPSKIRIELMTFQNAAISFKHIYISVYFNKQTAYL